MITSFEQPKHLVVVQHRRVLRAMMPMLWLAGGCLSATMVLTMWRRSVAGGHVDAWEWIAAASVGLVQVGLIRLGLWYEGSRRRYLEFQGGKIVLGQSGPVATKRFITWSMAPDPITSEYMRLRLVYRCGLGRKGWTMLLDDRTQIEELRRELKWQMPQQEAA